VNHPDNYAQRLVVEGETGWVWDPTATSLADAIAKGLGTPMDVRAYAAPFWDPKAASPRPRKAVQPVGAVAPTTGP
jgi:hypothetical protein